MVIFLCCFVIATFATVLFSKVDPIHLRLQTNHLCRPYHLRKCGMTCLLILNFEFLIMNYIPAYRIGYPLAIQRCRDNTAGVACALARWEQARNLGVHKGFGITGNAHRG